MGIGQGCMTTKSVQMHKPRSLDSSSPPRRYLGEAVLDTWYGILNPYPIVLSCRYQLVRLMHSSPTLYSNTMKSISSWTNYPLEF